MSKGEEALAALNAQAPMGKVLHGALAAAVVATANDQTKPGPHWGEKHLPHQCYADKPDQEIAGMVRMLGRSDLDHEAVCVAARDRIARLSFQLEQMAKARDVLLDRCAELESGAGPFTHRASDALALAVFDWIERRIIPTRSPVSDALESWAACRFDCLDGTEIQKLRAFAASKQEVRR